MATLLTLVLFGCGGDTLYTSSPSGPSDPDTGDPSGSLAVEVEVEAPDRMELADSVLVRIAAVDPGGASGIARVGYSALIHSSDGELELARSGERDVQAAAGEEVTATFGLDPDWLGDADLPTSFLLEVHGWAQSSDGRCAAAVPGGSEVQSCSTVSVDDLALTVGDAPGEDLRVTAVRGRTMALPASSPLVGDVQVDTLRERAYVSNRMSNRLHVLDAGAFAWAPDVNVGSEPWGLHLNTTGDTLLVANSGGTSVSHVSLAGTPQEVVSARLQTRNTVLFEVGIGGEEPEDEDDDRPTVGAEVRFLDFSDRPQFVAQDAEGRILYSTRPTGAAPRGTVRVIERQPGWDEHETRVLARVPKDLREGEGTLSILNADSVVPFEGGLIQIWDHPPGFPDQHIQSGLQPPLDAVEFMVTETESDIEYRADRAWELEAVSFADTTYVASSRDREFVAFGDGGQADVGRIVLWHAASGTIQTRLTVADLVNNASERVRALELNRDGSLGIARGAFGTYFFSNDLRLRGTVPEAAEGGGGAALHPDHPDTPAPVASTPTTVAFTATSDGAVRIMDTVHYTERGLIQVRDPVTGPLRVTPPFPSDNGGQGRNCSGAECVVAKVFAVTADGALLVLDVRASDIEAL